MANPWRTLIRAARGASLLWGMFVPIAPILQRKAERGHTIRSLGMGESAKDVLGTWTRGETVAADR
jgi:hypothetical protein